MKNSGEALLKSSGIRVTNQRTLILEILEKEKRHLDAGEIYKRVSRRLPRISLATVYRNLNTLKNLGLIKEVRFDEQHLHYELKETKEHYHMVCLGCGQVTEFDFPLTACLKKNVTQLKDIKIKGTQVNISGYCSKCIEEGGMDD
jgi:Fe2+ or Zn2+ uptake regulation protein